MISEFQNMVDEYGIPYKIIEKIENDISGDGTRNVQLTSLQREVFSNPGFWGTSNNDSNLIIQGATSSGKTLVAELLALQSVFKLNKHVVYLVPLKALVSEKVQQFRKDISALDNKMKINVYASSSDYQDHDTELAEGQYDIAVVVYEKFFAMLAEQKDNKFLEKCGLIIVDEIQLLESQDRGAKLEYSLTKVRNMYGDSIRILGLTTVDCDTNYVSTWLDAITIKNGRRPIGLKERIISLNGLYWERQVSGENEIIVSQDNYVEGVIEIPDEEKLKNQKTDVKRNVLLTAVLKKIYEEDPEKKIIVFASSRDRCKNVAKNIAKSNVYGQTSINTSLLEELGKADDESERRMLQNELLPYGIAYHSAALPMSLRELIEQEFKRCDGGIRLIVATETITIGMNLPADIMILYDNKVYRGADGLVDIKPQEYKNYIGRAGRLGITDEIGESYLFVNSDSDIQYYWNQYVNCKIEEVSSALLKSSPREKAPYFLNLLCKGKEEFFSEFTIEALAQKTLNASELKKKGEIYSIDTNKIVKDFKKVELIFNDEIDDELDDEEDISGYKLTKFGEMLAPYALSIKTCFRIKKYFRDGGNDMVGGLPVDYSSEDLRNEKYLLDILYLICKMPEVEKISHPKLPEPRNIYKRKVYSTIEKAIIEYFQKEKEKKGDQAFWKNSEIEKEFLGGENIEPGPLNAALRTILLFHWIQGELPSEIRKNTGLKSTEFILYTGDLARIGESCSYIVEAMSKCLFTNRNRVNSGALEHDFYILAEKLKYGLSNHSLIQIANRHIYGLSRNTIILMDKAAKENDFESIYLFIKSSSKKVFSFLSVLQRKELLQSMSERYDDRNIESLIDKIIADEIVEFELDTDLKTLAHLRNTKDWLESFQDVFQYLDIKVVKNVLSGNGKRLKWNDKTMHVVVLNGIASIDEQEMQKYNSFLDENVNDKILFVYNRELISELNNERMISISSDYLCKVVLEILAMSDCVNGSLICDFLYQKEGNVIDRGITRLQKEIDIALQDNIDECIPDDDTDSPLESYLRTFNYEQKQMSISPRGSRSQIHKVVNTRDQAEYIIKEICIPEDEDEYNRLNNRTRKIYENYENDLYNNLDDTLQIILNSEFNSDFSDNDKNDILSLCNSRKKNLKSGIDNPNKYVVQSLVFAAEGHKRLNEAKIVSSIKGAEQHHIVGIINPELYPEEYYSQDLKDVDTKPNQLKTYLYFSMKEMDGSIIDRQKELKNNKSEIVSLALQMLDALSICHKRNILHRDIKPNNILYCNDNEYCLCDFGSATKMNCNNKTAGVGTFDYMPPEAGRGEYTELSDMYSLARTLCYMYTGVRPMEIRDKDELIDILLKACNEESNGRFSSIEEFKDAIEAITLT